MFDNLSKAKKIILFVCAVTLIAFLLLVLGSRDQTNKGGTGGDYTPEGWVSLTGIEPRFGMSSDQIGVVREGLKNFLSSEYEPKDEYRVVVQKDTLETEFTPGLYRYISFVVDVDNKRQYLVHSAHNHILSSNSVYITNLKNEKTRDGLQFVDFSALLKGGIEGKIITSLENHFIENTYASNSVKVAEFNSAQIENDGSRTVTLTLVADDSQNIETTIFYDYNPNTEDTVSLNWQNGNKSSFKVK